MATKTDLVILGGGAAGTAAALGAAAAGLSVVLVEPGRTRRSRDAETALAELLAARPLSGAPVERRIEGWRAALRRAGESAAAAGDRRERRLAVAGVQRVGGTGRVEPAPGRVRLDGHELAGRHVLVATGSRALPPEACAGDPAVWTERSRLFDLLEPPETALVAGEGVDAAGLAGLLAAAGARVQLVCPGERLLPEADPDVSAAVERSLIAAGTVITPSARLIALRSTADGARAELDGGQACEATVAFTAGRREPRRADCGLDALDLALPAVLPEQVYETQREDLLLAGSVTGRRLGPEQATREGRAVAARIQGLPATVPHAAVPRIVAGVAACGWSGLSEPAARERGHALLVGRAQLPGLGPRKPGFLKLLCDASSNRVLGVHAVGARVGEAVLLAAVAVEAGASRLDLAAWAFPEDSPAAALVEAAARVEPA